MELSKEHRQIMRDWLFNYINDLCIHRVAPGEDPLPPLHPSHSPNGYTWLIVSRRGLMNPTFLKYMGILFWDLFAEKYKKERFQLAGLETACIPMICSIVMTSDLFGINDVNGFYIRKEPKKYGLFQSSEGFIENDVPVVVVDDFYNSRSTYMQVREYLNKRDIIMHEDAFAIINKQWEIYDKLNPDSHRLKMKAESENLNIVSLFRIDDFDLSHNEYHKKKYLKNKKAGNVV